MAAAADQVVYLVWLPILLGSKAFADRFNRWAKVPPGRMQAMESAAADLRYEEAALYRDQMRALSRVQARQYVESERGVDADVVACVREGGMACVNLVMIRGGRHVGDRSFFPANAAEATRRRSTSIRRRDPA